MAHYSYALYAVTFEPNTTEAVFADIGLQFRLAWEHCQDTKTGLLRHGYDYSKQQVWADPTTGAAPEVWDRVSLLNPCHREKKLSRRKLLTTRLQAIGWYLMALVDFLTPPLIIPSTHPTSSTMLTQLRALIPALLASADPKTGAWFLVISQPSSRTGNYIETSGTAMFVYSILKAVRLNLVEDKDGKIVAAANKAYEYLVREQIFQGKAGEMNMKGTVKVGSLE